MIYFPDGLATGAGCAGFAGFAAAVRSAAVLLGCLQQALLFAVWSFLQHAAVVADFLQQEASLGFSCASAAPAKNNIAVAAVISFFITICFMLLNITNYKVAITV
jgi:hypothetical protein